MSNVKSTNYCKSYAGILTNRLPNPLISPSAADSLAVTRQKLQSRRTTENLAPEKNDVAHPYGIFQHREKQ